MRLEEKKVETAAAGRDLFVVTVAAAERARMATHRPAAAGWTSLGLCKLPRWKLLPGSGGPCWVSYWRLASVDQKGQAGARYRELLRLPTDYFETPSCQRSLAILPQDTCYPGIPLVICL